MFLSLSYPLNVYSCSNGVALVPSLNIMGKLATSEPDVVDSGSRMT